MRHARVDYQRIQDPAGLIPDDEPVFLLRGQDLMAPALVNEWAAQASCNGVDPSMIEAAIGQAKRMMVWQDRHRWKIPDMPEEPLEQRSESNGL